MYKKRSQLAKAPIENSIATGCEVNQYNERLTRIHISTTAVDNTGDEQYQQQDKDDDHQYYEPTGRRAS